MLTGGQGVTFGWRELTQVLGGAAPTNNELREDSSIEVREDGSLELRE